MASLERFLMGLPAVLIGTFCIGFVIHTRLILPKSNSAYYKNSLDSQLREYDRLESNLAESTDLPILARTIDLSFRRLEYSGRPVDRWSQLAFYDKHVELVGSRGLNVGPFLSQATEFVKKRNLLLEELSLENPGVPNLAQLRAAELALEHQDQAEIRKSLTRFRSLKLERDSGKYGGMLVRLLIESAWLSQHQKLAISPDASELNEALKYAQTLLDQPSAMELEILAQTAPAKAIQIASESSSLIRDEFGINMAACIRGQWSTIRSDFDELLEDSRHSGRPNPNEIARQWARQIGRLLLSNIPQYDGAWRTNLPQALALACNLDLTSNELLSFIWQLSDSDCALDSLSVEAILISPGLDAGTAIRATAFVKRGDLASAKNLLANNKKELVWHIFAHQIMWCSLRNKDGCGDFVSVLSWMVTQRPKNGFYSFACGVVAMNLEDYGAAISHLSKAEADGYRGQIVALLRDRCEGLMRGKQ